MLGSNAQLTARRHDLVDLIGSRRDLGRHALGRRRQLVKLSFRCIHGLSDRSKRRFKSNGSLDCRCAQPQNGRGHHSGQRPACRRHFLADSVALFPEGFEVLACFRPCGLCRVQLLIGFSISTRVAATAALARFSAASASITASEACRTFSGSLACWAAVSCSFAPRSAFSYC